MPPEHEIFDEEPPRYRHLTEAQEPARSRMPLWLGGGIAILTAAALIGPRLADRNISAAPKVEQRASAPQTETPQVSVRTVTGPGTQKAAPEPRPTERPRATSTRRSTRTASRSEPRRETRRRRSRRVRTRVAAAPTTPTRSVETPRREERQVVVAREEREPRRRRTVRRERVRTEERRIRRVASGESANTLNNRAYRLQKRGRHAEAEPLLREALRKQPNHPYAQYNLGWSLVRQGKSKEAVLYLKRTSRAQPRRWEPADKLADAYEQMGDKERASEMRSRSEALRGGGRSRPSRKRTDDRADDRAQATPPVEMKTAVSTAAWQQSTDRREETWLREKREGQVLQALGKQE